MSLTSVRRLAEIIQDIQRRVEALEKARDVPVKQAKKKKTTRKAAKKPPAPAPAPAPAPEEKTDG